jgi:hypothetical protein
MQVRQRAGYFLHYVAATTAMFPKPQIGPGEAVTDVRQEHVSHLFLLLKSGRNVARLLSY